MDKICCNTCWKELNTSMEIEYSREVNEFFCSPDCARDRYFDLMQSVNVDLKDKDFLENENVKVIKGNLVFID